MLHKILKGVAPVLALALAAGVAVLAVVFLSVR
jgi:hypothetical protein